MITSDAIERLTETAEKDALDGIFFDSEAIYENEDLRKLWKTDVLFALRTGGL